MKVGKQQQHPQLQLQTQTRAGECKQRWVGGANTNEGGGVWGVWTGTRGFKQAWGWYEQAQAGARGV
jgi:hypothetical protein